MIGNDIVDLAQATKESNWQRRGWLDKVFVPSEQALITNTKNPDSMVWLLWSMKEAAYKAHQRVCQHAPRFNPKSFVCTLDLITTDSTTSHVERKGVVMVDGVYYTTQSTITPDYVYTTAIEKEANIEVKSIVITNPKTQEIFAKAQSFLPQNELNRCIQKDRFGIPHIFEGNQLTSFLISISHHGRFGGCFLNV